LFWGVEFDFDGPHASNIDLKGEGFAMMVQARALKNDLVIMGFTGGSNLEGTKGSHILLSPAYNVTKEEIEKIVDIVAQSVEECLTESKI
jgi:adenosylmethionine-8-amino-7-oxononanoate aminotransferase